MTERFTSDLLFILIVLIVAAILGFIIGYLIKKQKHAKLVKELEEKMAKQKADYEASISSLKADHEKEAGKLKAELDNCRKELKALQAAGEFDAEAARKVFGKKVNKDDLKMVEGIGEKIESILKASGIDTWAKLSDSKPEEIKELLLEKGGSQYAIHEPRTWPDQARLMTANKWEELKKLQDELSGGR